MLPMMSLASSLCVSTMSDVVFRYVMLSTKIMLLSCVWSSLLMIVMEPPLSASLITMLVLLNISLRALCCCLGRLGLTLCGVLQMKLLFWSLVSLTNESIKVFLPLGGEQRVLQRWLCTSCLLASPVEGKY